MIRRVLFLVLTLTVIFVASRAIIRTLPGDPIETLVMETGTKIPIAQLRQDLHLDQPFSVALVNDFRQFLQGNWGTSLISRQPILPTLQTHLVSTLQLNLAALLMGIFASLILALLTFCLRSFHHFVSIWAIGASAVPALILAPMILAISKDPDFVFYPALVLAIPFTGIWARLIRLRIQETLQQPYSQSARSCGLPEHLIVFKYGLFPALGALLAQLGTHVGAVFSGSLVTEFIFDRAGMGTLLIDSVLKRDYPLIEAAIWVSAAICLLGTLAGDSAQRWVDPRI